MITYSYIESIANYALAVWGFRDYSAPRVLQNKISKFDLGVHRFAPVSATGIEMGIMNIRYARWLEIVRLHNRIMNMDDNRWTRKYTGGNKVWAVEVGSVT